MSIDENIARFDWARIQTHLGKADMVPDALRELTAASDDKQAARLRLKLERSLLSAAGPSEACAPAATVLVAALPQMTSPGRSAALHLLSRISAAEITGPAHEQTGAVDVAEIRHAVAGGFPYYIAVLRSESAPEADLYFCVDLMDILALYDRSLATDAIAALKAVRTAGRAGDLAELIEDTLDDLNGPPSNPE